ncbi:hypothetical protein SEA_CAELUM_31 [Streptomyces phage Caelum]|uniref:Uncharacterized protein n=1 Tax=Streptomyces phage Caelum TaxID=2530160 RepID=A0A481VZJ0_9CAUD|nr:hypothetical protein KGG86_gp31 [Streptomyces phage Caelum]QBI99442.1 hypothetical protein SEA_CAELUM_31 [Streptomyces phage Caelum]
MEHFEGAVTSSARGGWCGGYQSPDALITLVVDEAEYDFHIDARPGYKASVMREVLKAAESRGLELLDEDECEPEILEDGTVRIYLAPVTEYAVVQTVAPIRPARSMVRRAAGTFALAACVASALLLPSPVGTSYPDAISEVFDSITIDEPGPVEPAPEPMSPNEGVLSGTEPPGNSAAVPARASESLRSKGRVEQAADRSRDRRQAEGAHSHHHVHRLHRGQVEPDRLARPDGPARVIQAARSAGSR